MLKYFFKIAINHEIKQKKFDNFLLILRVELTNLKYLTLKEEEERFLAMIKLTKTYIEPYFWLFSYVTYVL